MYAIRWADSDGLYEAVCARSEDAWRIYRALKKSYEKTRPLSDCWIEIFVNGCRCNPERGGQLPICREGEGPVFILKHRRQT